MTMNYATLIGPKTQLGSIANWVNYSDTKIPAADILFEAQQYIYDNLRITEMKSIDVPIALASGLRSVAIPTQSHPSGVGTIQTPLSVINFQDQYKRPIKPRDLKSVQDRRVNDNTGNPILGDGPQFYSISKDNYEFDTAPNSNITLYLSYFGRDAFLGDGTFGTVSHNFLTDIYPHILRPACLMLVADFLNDDAKYNRYMARLQGFFKQSMQSEEMNQLGMQVDMDYTESVP